MANLSKFLRFFDFFPWVKPEETLEKSLSDPHLISTVDAKPLRHGRGLNIVLTNNQ